MIQWQKIRLSDNSNVGAPGPLPDAVAGWAGFPHVLADPVGTRPEQLNPVAGAELGITGFGWLPVTTPDPGSRVISRIDFMRRFTQAEMDAILASADTHIVAFRFMMQVVSGVDLDDADTINAVNYMEHGITPALLATGRAAAILT